MDKADSPPDAAYSADRKTSQQGARRGSSALHTLWLRSLGGGIAAGFMVIVWFGWTMPAANVAVGMLLAGGSLLSGSLLGFLFGVPRSARLPGATTPAERASQPAAGISDADAPDRYRPNTNLEEVSDWLTKILVGVGLTQLVYAPSQVLRFGDYFAPALGAGRVGAAFSVCVLVYFSVAGFLVTYLWTRLYLGGALAGADAEALARVERKLDAHQLQAERDALALATVAHQLRGDVSADAVPAERLRKLISEASGSVRAQVFYQAAGQRAANWEDMRTKPLMERTIPIFEALAFSDRDAKAYHQNHGQLGFALKDQRSPDWARALSELDAAIAIRGEPKKYGYTLYEFNRALCRINLDGAFVAAKPSDPALAALIGADLQVVASSRYANLLERTAEVVRWMKLNEDAL
jgi:hypothetical protein